MLRRRLSNCKDGLKLTRWLSFLGATWVAPVCTSNPVKAPLRLGLREKLLVVRPSVEEVLLNDGVHRLLEWNFTWFDRIY